MGDFQSSYTVSPPPAPSSSDKASLAILYYGLVVVGTAAIALTVYNLIIMKRNRGRNMQSQHERSSGLVEVVMESSIENTQRRLLSSFKYKKEGGDDYECPVCLSGFEEGEEVRKLPRCKHSFHAQCIDMWLYSHFDCPICRTPVGPFCTHRIPPENSRPRLPESGGVSSV